MDQYLVPAVFHSAGRTRKRENISASRNTGAGSGLDGGCANGLEAEPTKQLAKAGNGLVLHLFNSFGRNVTSCNPCAACRDDTIHLRVVDPAMEARDNRFAIVLFDPAVDKKMASGGDKVRQNVARPILGEASTVRNRQ